MILAVFSYRYDVGLVPELLQNIGPAVDGWVALDDRDSTAPVSNEVQRRRLLINRARELGATWVLAIDPDERVEYGAATRIRALTTERQRVVWEFSLREMFTPSMYRIDGIWATKRQGRLFPVFDGPLCDDQPLHGAWCAARMNYLVLHSGLNLYHLKMISHDRRVARRDLYKYLDPMNTYQSIGYDYLLDDVGAKFEQIPADRDFFPAYEERGLMRMAEVPCVSVTTSNPIQTRTRAPTQTTVDPCEERGPSMVMSQLGCMRILRGDKVCQDSRLAVVVIGLGAPKSLRQAVGSLIDQQDATPEVVVINSGGGDVSAVLGSYIRSVILVELRHPVFVGAARNIGIQTSSAPFVAFLAADCVAAPGWVAARIAAHMEGNCAVGSVVENDRRNNSFSWDAHLMTYGHRMAGEPGTAVYGASYDRTLFDKYGYFSEAAVVGEDTEFHARFRPYDPILLNLSIRTIHCNPAGPISLLTDQFRRGLRSRFQAEYMRADFSLGYIVSASVGRVVRAVRLATIRLRGKEKSIAIAGWSILPLCAIAYAAGAGADYIKLEIAERLFRKATRLVLTGRPSPAIPLLRRAISLRRGATRYHLALSTALKDGDDHDGSARELQTSLEIERRPITDFYRAVAGSLSPDLKAASSRDPIHLQVVVFSNSTEVHLAEILRAIEPQLSLGGCDVLVVQESRRRTSRLMHRIQNAYAHVATFLGPQDLVDELRRRDSYRDIANRSFVIMIDSSCMPPPDWLLVLRAHILSFPEVDLFQGACIPRYAIPSGIVERVAFSFGLFPSTAENGGSFHFACVGNLACDAALLITRSGWWKGQSLGFWSIAECVLSAGGANLYAAEWEIEFGLDTTLTGLLKRSYQDGHNGAVHAMGDHTLARRLLSTDGVGGPIARGWRFAKRQFSIRRFDDEPFLVRATGFMILFAAGLAHQIGWWSGTNRRWPRQ